MLKTMKDANFDIPVQGSSYAGSERARKASSAASQGQMHTPMVGEGPKSTATQSDASKTHPGDRGNSLRQSTKPRVLPTLADSPTPATNPDLVNPQGRPGLGGKFQRKGRGTQ